MGGYQADVGATFGLPRERIRQRVAVGYHAHGQAALYVRNMKVARRLLMAALRRGLSSRRMIDLAAASLPPAMLDLRRRLLQGA